MANLGRALVGLATRSAALRGRPRMIEIDSLTVQFGGVTPLDNVSMTFPPGTCGLIGPNGAGQDNVLQRLERFRGTRVGERRAFGENLLAMPNYRRARWGLRRTFQTEQAIEALSVFDNVAMVHEHCSERGSRRRADVVDAIKFVGSTWIRTKE